MKRTNLEITTLSALLLSAMISGISANAADGVPQIKQETPPSFLQFVELYGQTSKMVFADGREATLKMTVRKPISAKVQMVGYENNCFPQAQPLICDYNLETKVEAFSMVWTKNPDPQKIGMPVRNKNNQADPYIKFDIDFFAIGNQFFKNDLFHLKLDQIKCQDYGWLNGVSTSTPPQNANITFWSSETMLPNPDTGVSENRTLNSITNIDLNLKNQALEVTKYESYQSGSSFFPFIPPLLQNSMIILKKTDLSECQISTSNNFTEITKAIDHFSGLPTSYELEAAPEIRLKMNPSFKFILDALKYQKAEDFQ